jgi:hypothetical protein
MSNPQSTTKAPDAEERRGRYLKRAAQAESSGEKTQLTEVREAYQHLSDSWRSLAKTIEDTTSTR